MLHDDTSRETISSRRLTHRRRSLGAATCDDRGIRADSRKLLLGKAFLAMPGAADGSVKIELRMPTTRTMLAVETTLPTFNTASARRRVYILSAECLRRRDAAAHVPARTRPTGGAPLMSETTRTVSRPAAPRPGAELALLGGPRAVPKDSADGVWPIVTEADEQAVLRVLRSGQLNAASPGEPEVGRLEASWAHATGARHCVAVASGTAALHVALRACG